MISIEEGKLRKMWKERAALDFDRDLAEEVAKTDHLEALYHEAYERSMKPKRETSKKVRRGQKGPRGGGGESAELRNTETEQIGDVRCLQGIERTIELRAKLKGLLDPNAHVPRAFEITFKLVDALAGGENVKPAEIIRGGQRGGLLIPPPPPPQAALSAPAPAPEPKDRLRCPHCTAFVDPTSEASAGGTICSNCGEDLRHGPPS